MCPRHMVFASFLILWPGTPMNLLYAVSAQGNPLYQGKFGLHGRYQTYGQHSFIYDLIAAAYRRGVRVTLLVEGLSGFPLAEPLKKYAHVGALRVRVPHLLFICSMSRVSSISSVDSCFWMV